MRASEAHAKSMAAHEPVPLPADVLRNRLAALAAWSIEREVAPPAPLFHDLWRPLALPVIFTGLLAKCDALRWSFDAFVERFGDTPMRFVDYQDGRSVCRWPTREVIAHMRSGANAYSVARSGVLQEAPWSSLWDEVRLPAGYLASRGIKTSAMWLGPAGTTTPLHFDTCDILLTQVHGRKNVLLVPQAALEFFEHNTRHMVREDALPALLASDVPRFDVMLEPGEALFIPAGWHHRVVALSESISLSINDFPRNTFPDYAPQLIARNTER